MQACMHLSGVPAFLTAERFFFQTSTVEGGPADSRQGFGALCRIRCAGDGNSYLLLTHSVAGCWCVRFGWKGLSRVMCLSLKYIRALQRVLQWQCCSHDSGNNPQHGWPRPVVDQAPCQLGSYANVVL